ncbi:hypothetical protein BSZ37_08110 [Rubrivirga marina]|uniref:Lipid/polyisoprenoid-binding YceI-like domain-containing protein n=1 Tax=Rubrivirga marina TaxID=1196024 RepID=A0A271J5W8_9BACT|nr:hypothetical protein BSZ37_08110 [Rubrivirga marina]
MPAVPAGTYAIDPAHSRAEFRVRHLGISTVTGRFGDVSGTFTVGDDLGTLDATAVIDATTIDTGNEQRDGHLQSPDFFDVAQYPEITFQSTEVRPAEDGGFILVGDLTMHGVTRPVELEAEYIGSSSMGETQKVGFSARGEITRQDWGLTWAQTNEAGEALVGDEVELIIEVEADRQAETADAAPADTTAGA